jgi:hypothetical protein
VSGSWPRRGLISGLTLGVSGLAAIGFGGAAQASTHVLETPAVQIGWADSATPAKAHALDGTSAKIPDLPVGTRTDKSGVSHTTRVFATFDLSGLEGSKAYGGTLTVDDTDPAHCAGRDIQVWRTAAVSTTPNWNKLPAEQTLLAEKQTGDESCAGPYLSFDVGAAVTDAVAHKQRRLTLELRVPAAAESDPAAARTFDGSFAVTLDATYNHPPQVDSANLFNDGVACSQLKPYPHIGGFGGRLQALITDPDENEQLTTTYAIWPAGDPDARTTYTQQLGTSGRVSTEQLPAGSLTDGTSYVWQAQVSDGADTSAWSKKCYFVYDGSAPSAPKITSSNYPEGGNAPLGVPATFTLSGHGDKDIAGFQYGWNDLGVGTVCSPGQYGQTVCPDPLTGPGLVRASQPGGKATVTLNPQWDGPETLVVRSVDAAGRVSDSIRYQTFVPATTPSVEVVGGDPHWNQDVTLKLTAAAGLPGLSGFEVTVGDDQPVDVPADEDGTALYTFRATAVSGPHVTVHTYSDNGFRSPDRNWSFSFDPWPGVSSDVYVWPDDGSGTGGVGVPGTFTFTPPPGLTDVTAYQYSFDSDGGDPQTVPAGPDGTAQITWTPSQAGYVTLIVNEVRADGTVYDEPNWYFFQVAGDS